jgi:hypothetical protein
MDSPVPTDQPVFDTSFIKDENVAPLSGQGTVASPAQAGDAVIEITGGVLSR